MNSSYIPLSYINFEAPPTSTKCYQYNKSDAELHISEKNAKT